jgi:hypothetical protein
VHVLADDGLRPPAAMAERLRALPGWPAPAVAKYPELLTGLERIAERAAPWLAETRPVPALSRFA